MIFKIEKVNDKWLNEAYERSTRDLCEFFDKNWVMGRPKIFIGTNRETLDSVSDRVSNRWVLGYTGRLGVYLLEQGKFAKESEHQLEYDNREYEMLMKHELAHVFFELVAQTPGYRKPSWLSEGVSMYVWQVPCKLDVVSEGC